jgi:S-adenosylmethionine:tRNA ribosyltransferase-isomerase
MLRLSQFDFSFPQELIAQRPLSRGEARMMVLQRQKNGSAATTHDYAKNLIRYLAPGDGLVLNNTEVIPARMPGHTATGAKAEILLLHRVKEKHGVQWEVMVKPGRRCRKGTVIYFGDDFNGRIVEVLPCGNRIMEFSCLAEQFQSQLYRYGKTPLPPYIKRAAEGCDKHQYQSVFAEKPGSVAAPTASFHLSEKHLSDMEQKGIELIKVTLHIGAGTFLPVKNDNIEKHEMHEERYEVSPEASERINRIKKRKKRIWAVGTTVARILETVSISDERRITAPATGMTDKFIYPGYQWKVVDGLLTNFHWPKSTLFMLVCSLLGLNGAHQAYQEAFIMKYRLFSYGDSMLIF